MLKNFICHSMSNFIAWQVPFMEGYTAKPKTPDAF